MRDFDSHDDPDDIEWVSKSQIKREMHALQDLGRALTELTPAQRAELPLSETLSDALELADRIRNKREALRRHLQYIGKLMRSEDDVAIAEGLNRLKQGEQHAVHIHHLAEQWRERLLDDPEQLTQFLDQYPCEDIQHLRQTLRRAVAERGTQKPPRAFRELFRQLRDGIAASDAS